MALVEFCVEGLASAIAAAEGGAERIELCENLDVGGVTPGPGVLVVARRRLSIPIHAIIRPRGGDFVYGDAEFEAMGEDVEFAKSIGLDGVVLGMLDAGGAIDPRTARLVDRARPMAVTFHKAFDEAGDAPSALDALIGLGVDRVLTSGRAPAALGGLGLLGELRARAGGRIVVLPGGRIGLAEIPAFLGAGFGEVHVGSAATRGGRADAGAVRAIVEAARAGSSPATRSAVLGPKPAPGA